MKPTTRRTIRYLAASAALAVFAGCSNAPAPHAETSPATPAPAVQTHPAALDEIHPGPVINAFGEIDGVDRRFTPASNEAAFQHHTAPEEGVDADVTADPAGKWLVFSSTRHQDHPDIYLQRVGGSSVIQLTSDPADDAQPVFSPDGKKIAFASNRSGNWDIYLMDADGRNIEQVTAASSQEMHPSFSPDGTRLAFCALSSHSDQWELWTIDLITHTRKMIGNGLFPAWSPQKGVDRIAFQRPRQRGSRWFSIWTLDLLDGEPRKLTEVAVSNNAACVCPAWSPDGARIAFTTILHPQQADASHKPRDTQDVWIVSADGTGRQRLTAGGNVNLSPFWSSDNRVYFISDRTGSENVWSVQVDTSRAPVNAGAPANSDKSPAAVGNTDTKEVGR
jgi:TolB protein